MVILGLGSNVGDRMEYLKAAVRKLSALMQDMRLSRVFESPALLPPDATADMNLPYLNMAIAGETRLSPRALLAEIKSMEQALGRVQRCVWGPREIDIDILAVDNLVTESPELMIPHREMLNRDFVLFPFNDIAPDWRYPVGGIFHDRTVSDIMAAKGFTQDKVRDTGLKIDG